VAPTSTNLIQFSIDTYLKTNIQNIAQFIQILVFFAKTFAENYCDNQSFSFKKIAILMGFSMASQSPGNEKQRVIYINFDVSAMVYCLHQENQCLELLQFLLVTEA
jgi:hypothetical protein